MSYIGDFALGVTFDTKFTTRRFTTGAPFALASGVISAYVDNGTTQITAGITLTADFDTVTGLNNIRVVATSGNGFAAGTNVQLVITTGTVDSVSVVGEVVAEFSIEARSSLRPTVAARTLDVTATGAAGIDWANVENPTTALNLSATNIDVDQVVASVSGAVGSVTGAVGSVTGAVGSVTGNVGGNVNGNVVGSVASVTAGVTVTTNNDKTGYSIGAGGIANTAFAAGAIDAASLATDAGQELADRFLLRGLQTGADGPRTVQDALRASRNRVDTSGGSFDVYEEDDTTQAWTGVLTRTAVDPITQVNPT